MKKTIILALSIASILPTSGLLAHRGHTLQANVEVTFSRGQNRLHNAYTSTTTRINRFCKGICTVASNAIDLSLLTSAVMFFANGAHLLDTASHTVSGEYSIIENITKGSLSAKYDASLDGYLSMGISAISLIALLYKHKLTHELSAL